MKSEIKDKIASHFSKYKTRRYRKGQILLLAGDNVEHIYHLVSGTVKQYAISYRGDELVLNMFKPPAFFPMSHAMNGTPSKYIFEAETEVEVHLAPASETIDFLKSNPDVLYDLLGRVYSGTDGLLGRLEHLMTSSAQGRLLYELLLEAKRFGSSSGVEYTVNINEKDLGARAGLSRETISREIQKLKSKDLIVTGRGSITIPDIGKLEENMEKYR